MSGPLIETLERRLLLSTLTGLSADAQVKAGSPNVVSDTADPMLVGYSGSSGMDAIFVFQLPDLPAGQRVDSASLRTYYYGRDGVPSFNADLYGLDYRSSSDVLPSDFYAGESDPSSSARLIQDNIAEPSISMTGHSVNTDGAGSQELVDYLNAQYAAGASAGDYVFLRMTPDAVLASNYTRYKFKSADGTNSFYYPQLTFTTADIPTTETLTSLAADAQVNGGSPNIVSDTTDPMLVGYSGNSGRNAVFVFQLPALPSGQRIDTASLRTYYYGRDGVPSFNGDLYGLGYRNSSDVLPGDFYAGAGDSSSSVQLIQDNFATTALGSLGRSVYTSPSGGSALADYLNAQYEAGATAGSYVFLRLSPDAVLSNNYTRYRFKSADGTNSFYYPKLTFNTVEAGPAWGQVRIDGGGYVTGFVASTTVPGLYYARTDVGGAFRYDSSSGTWTSLSNSFGKPGQYHVVSLALDPGNPDRVYMAAGEYSDSPYDVYVSDDRGQTWAHTNIKKPDGSSVWMSGNSQNPIRFGGERLMVDPNNSDIVYFSSQRDGLWKRTGSTWAQVSSFTEVGDYSGSGSYAGLPFVAFDAGGGTTTVGGQTVTATIYTGVYSSAGNGGIWRSTDGGQTWAQLGGYDVDRPTRGEVDADGTLYVTANGAVVKVTRGSSTVTSITPSAGGTGILYSGLAASLQNGGTVLVAERNTNPNNRIWRSTDSGSTWTQLVTSKTNTSVARLNSQELEAISDLQIDPFDESTVLAGDFLGVMRTQDVTAATTHWQTLEQGIEETVVLNLSTPPAKAGTSIAPLFSVEADVMGFRHDDILEQPHRIDNTPVGYLSGIDYSESDPAVLARVGSIQYGSNKTLAYSTDGGVTWTQSTSIPSGAVAGRVAVSATDSSRFVWLPQGKAPYVTANRGVTWTAATGAPTSTAGGEFDSNRQPLAADRVNGNKFYMVANVSGSPGHLAFYRSTDGGATWSNVSTVATYSGTTSSIYTYKVEAMPGVEGEVWVSVAGRGLYRSTDSGSTWSQVSNISGYALFAFGESAPGRTNPTVFVKGTALVNGVATTGVLRSDDMGDTWVKISVPAYALGNTTSLMEADRQVFGRVYFGSSGSGIFYADSSHVFATGGDEMMLMFAPQASSPDMSVTTGQVSLWEKYFSDEPIDKDAVLN